MSNTITHLEPPLQPQPWSPLLLVNVVVATLHLVVRPLVGALKLGMSVEERQPVVRLDVVAWPVHHAIRTTIPFVATASIVVMMSQTTLLQTARNVLRINKKTPTGARVEAGTHPRGNHLSC